MELKQYTIFDLDGCIADDRRRRPLLAKGYDAYHEDLIHDPLANAAVVTEAFRTAGTRILFLTARPEKWRAQTAAWIAKSIPGAVDFELVMRAEDDQRGSVALKRAAVRKIGARNVRILYDDRDDIVKAIRELNVNAEVLKLPIDASDILGEMAATFAERNAVYRDNYTLVAPVIKALFPDGVPSELVTKDRWHLFELIIIKLTRFAKSELIHQDSIHDVAVYAAMIESDLRRKG